MKKTYNRLVRDTKVKRLEDMHIHCDYKILKDDEEYKKALYAKIEEELKEYIESGKLGELADIVEAVEALARVSGMTPKELAAVKKDKFERKGGYYGRYYMIETTSD